MAEKTRIEGAASARALIGKDLSPGPWSTLTFAEIQRFADATGDHQWIHVDRERALRESPFGGPVAHGYFSLARIGGMFFEAVEIAGFGLVLNYGLNKVRFPAPLREGAQYRLRPQVLSVNDIEKGVEVVFKCTIEIKDEPKPACVAECVFRMLG